MSNLIRFVVVDGNVFGAILPTSRLSVQVLSTTLGAATDWRNGTYPLPLDPAWVRSSDCPKPLDLAAVNAGTQAVKFDPAHVRPATRADFAAFRLVATSYQNDPAYEFPAA